MCSYDLKLLNYRLIFFVHRLAIFLFASSVCSVIMLIDILCCKLRLLLQYIQFDIPIYKRTWTIFITFISRVTKVDEVHHWQFGINVHGFSAQVPHTREFTNVHPQKIQSDINFVINQISYTRNYVPINHYYFLLSMNTDTIKMSPKQLGFFFTPKTL